MKVAHKHISWFCLAIWIVMSSMAFSQANGEQYPLKSDPNKPALKTKKAGELLSDEQIAALLTERTNEKTGTKIIFQAQFGMRNLTQHEKKKYIQSGKIPVRLTCDLYESKKMGGRMVTKRLSNKTVRFYILDAEKNILDYKALSIDKMCPS